MPTRPFRSLILRPNGQKTPKFEPFKNEGIHEGWVGHQTAGIDPLLSFPVSPGTGGERQKAGVGATGRMRQSTKSLRSSPLRGGGSREAGSKPID